MDGSTDTMWRRAGAWEFRWFTSAASVLVRPDPGTPLTRTRPNSFSTVRPSDAGSPSDSKVGSTSGMTRITTI